MTRKLCRVLLLAGFLYGVNSVPAKPKEDIQPPTVEDPNVPFKRISSSINKFSNRLYNVMNEYTDESQDALVPSAEDLVYSPISIFTSLSTLQSGSTHETKTELGTILSLAKINDTLIQEGVNSILDTFKKDSSVNIVNRVFLDHAFHPTNQYVNSVRDKFHGEVVQTHFGNATAASLFVNKHVYQASHGVLQDVISVDLPENDEPVTESSLNATSGLVQSVQGIDGGLMLVSGMTFEGDWDRPFTPMLTSKARFTREDGVVEQVDMMHRDAVYLHAEIPELNASALSIPYKSYRYALTILLPEEGVSIAELEDNLESFPCIAVLSRLKRQYMQVSLPRFQVETTVDLIDPLEKLGIKRVFSETGAQLGKLVKGVSTGELYLTNAVHKVLFDVREGGSHVKSQNFSK